MTHEVYQLCLWGINNSYIPRYLQTSADEIFYGRFLINGHFYSHEHLCKCFYAMWNGFVWLSSLFAASISRASIWLVSKGFWPLTFAKDHSLTSEESNFFRWGTFQLKFTNSRENDPWDSKADGWITLLPLPKVSWNDTVTEVTQTLILS